MKKTGRCIFCIVLTFVLLLSGCKSSTKPKPKPPVTSSQAESSVVEPPVVTTVTNPLTGLNDLNKSAANNRPVAIMINNIRTAQKVQEGLSKANIVYELYVEGGITRLLAVYKDLSVVKELGTVRSARYSYVDLAAGHDAIYVHCGMDPTYCAPYMKRLGFDNFNLNSGSTANYGFRKSNGLSSEHTVYTTPEKLNNGFKTLGWRTEIKQSYNSNWQNFAPPDKPAALSSNPATQVTVPMSSSYVSGFNYDPTTQMYLKTENGAAHTDKLYGTQLSYKNVLVLFSTIVTQSDGKHVNTTLSSGSGYYISQGTYIPVKWSKGGTYASLKLTNEAGQPLNYNAGSTWVCFANNNIRSRTIIQ